MARDPEKKPTFPDRAAPRRALPDSPAATRSMLTTPVARRALLAGSAAVVAAAGYGAVAPGDRDDAPPENKPPDPRKIGYRETDHIRQFYARARF